MLDRLSPVFLFALVAVTALGPLAMQIFPPALPVIQQDLGSSVSVTQLALSASMVAIAVATLIYGPLSDRFGRRPVLLVGLAIYLVGSLLCTLAPNVETLIFGRIVQAAGGTAGIVLARAIVRDVYAHEKVASVLAYLTMAMVVAPMLAPAIGGALTDLLGWRSIFAFAGLVGLPVLALVLLRLTETGTRPPHHRGFIGMIEGIGLLLASAAFRGYALAGAFGLAAFFSFIAGAPFIMVTLMGRPVTEYGLYFVLVSLCYIAGNFATARYGSRVGIDRMILTGCVVSLIAVAVEAALAVARVWTPLALFGPMTAIAFGNGLTMANLQAGALGVYPRSAGTASGLSGFLQMAIAAGFAQAVGSLQGDTPLPTIGFMALGLSLALACFLAARRAQRRRHCQASEAG